MIKKTLAVGIAAATLGMAAVSSEAQAADPVLGALIGGGIGAAIGHDVNHHNGAAAGAVIGAVLGSSIAASSGPYYDGGYYGPQPGYGAPAPAYEPGYYGAPAPAYAAPVYYAPPAPVYYGPSVVYSVPLYVSGGHHYAHHNYYNRHH